MNCKQATWLLSLQLDHRLSVKQKLALKFHLGMCGGCRNFSKHMGEIRSISNEYVKDEKK
ncbi:zf-HC2 domain-containing protein [Celerinatantimonas sp. YJH-8]|uniref:zf-HC2 domain-containing protein n=1 Tax=Celerinatantimonas sp. YJH-8 TaxID=3228714 RepID=UPI0038C8B606